MWKSMDNAPQDGTIIQARKKNIDGKWKTRKCRYDQGWMYTLFGKYNYIWKPDEWRPIK
jgi:hypothetical protein